MAKTRIPTLRESEGCCIGCLGHGMGYTRLDGKTPSYDRMLCMQCHKQGFRVEPVMEGARRVPWAWKLTTPEGDVLDVTTAPQRPASAGKMKKLRAKDQVIDEGLADLYRSIRRAANG